MRTHKKYRLPPPSLGYSATSVIPLASSENPLSALLSPSLFSTAHRAPLATNTATSQKTLTDDVVEQMAGCEAVIEGEYVILRPKDNATEGVISKDKKSREFGKLNAVFNSIEAKNKTIKIPDNVKIYGYGSLEYLFRFATIKSLGNLGNMDTSHVTSMKGMFVSAGEGRHGFSDLGNIDKWDTSHVTDMNGMFAWCESVTSFKAIENWDTSSVTNMEHMLCTVISLRDPTLDLSKWDRSNVTTIARLFNWQDAYDEDYHFESIRSPRIIDLSNITKKADEKVRCNEFAYGFGGVWICKNWNFTLDASEEQLSSNYDPNSSQANVFLTDNQKLLDSVKNHKFNLMKPTWNSKSNYKEGYKIYAPDVAQKQAKAPETGTEVPAGFDVTGMDVNVHNAYRVVEQKIAEYFTKEKGAQLNEEIKRVNPAFEGSFKAMESDGSYFGPTKAEAAADTRLTQGPTDIYKFVIELKVTPPQNKVKVNDASQLTDTEITAIKNAFIEANRDSLGKQNPDIDIKINPNGGSATLSVSSAYANIKEYFENVEIPASTLIQEDTDLHVETPDTKVKVDNPGSLTPAEKQKVKEAIKNKNQDKNLTDAEITVEDNGNTTITRGNKTSSISGANLVEEDTDLHVETPDTKVKVDNPSSLTNAEKQKVKDAIKNKNQDKNLTDAEITVGDDGGATIRRGNKTSTIPGTNLVEEDTDLHVETPDTKVKVDNPGSLTPAEKQKVKEAIKNKNQDKNLTDAEITVEDNGDTTIRRGNKTSTIPGSSLVEEDTDLHVETPDTKVKVDNPSSLTNEEKQKVKDAIKNKNQDKNLTDAEITVEDNGNTTITRGNKTSTISGSSLVEDPSKGKKPQNAPVTMYRLYNPWTGEHLFTIDINEVKALTPLGWNYEGAIGKVALHGEKGGVYRLYNPFTGEHHFTMSEDEVKACVAQGWRNEGIKFFSVSDPHVVLKGMVSMYNPYEKAFYHHYTSDAQEITTMQNAGWKREDIKWYVM